MKLCPKCKNEHFKNGIYCSRACANSRIWSEEDKVKKSLANKGRCVKKTTTRKARDLSYMPEMLKKKFEKTLSRFILGEVSDRDTLRRVIGNVRGYHCEIQGCHISDWMGKEITLQVDHIDGDASNNFPNNVRLICPNCHSQTDTFSGRNKGRGRKFRNLPLK